MSSSSLLASLQAELRRELQLLNELCHPVHPVAPERISAVEARVAELRSVIADLRDKQNDVAA